MSSANYATDHKNKVTDAASENVAETTQDALRSGITSASESARRFTDQLTKAYGFSGENREELTEQVSQNLEAISEASVVLTRGLQDVSRTWFGLMQESLQRNLDGFNALARCRSVPDFMAVQSDLIRMNLEQTVQGTRRVAEVTTRMADEGDQTVKALTKKVRRAA